MTDKELILLNELLEIETKEKAKESFWDFCLYYDSEFFNRRLFLKEIATVFQRVANNEIKRAAVSMPPRSGKSYITSLFSAWMIGNNPTGSVMRNCCTATLYQKFSYDTRDIIRSQKFADIFPDVKLSKDKTAITGWNVEDAKQVSYFGNGVGGTIIGFGASLVAITDDLFKDMEDALSETVLEKTHLWKESTHDSRLEKGCPSIDIGTRWRVNDVIGKQEQIKNYYDEIIRVPALDENDKSFCEDVKSTIEYLDTRNLIDEMIWLAEYQQQPIESKGLLFPKSQLNWFNSNELRKDDIVTYFAYCDVADQGDDFLSMPFVACVGNKYYITDVVFTQDPAELTEPLVASKILEYHPSRVVFESNNSGKSYSRRIKDLITGIVTTVQTKTNTTNKETRILMNAGIIKDNFHFRSDYQRGSDYDKFIQQLTSYIKMTKNKHDDAADSLAGLAEMICSNKNKINWLK